MKLFDGQHKAVAQIIGNKRKKLQCIVFVEADIAELRLVIYQAHTDLVQQRYKKSHIDAKLADIFAEKVDAYRRQIGDPEAQYSEAIILRGEFKAEVRKYLIAWVIDELRAERAFVDKYAAEDRAAQKTRPLLWQSLEKFVAEFCLVAPANKPSDSPQNYRSDEINNLCFLVDQIEAFAIKGKWDPENPLSKLHQLARTYFYKTAFNNWVVILKEALRFALEQMENAKSFEPLCYRPEFSPQLKDRFIQIIRKLFDDPLWVKELFRTKSRRPTLMELLLKSSSVKAWTT